MLTTRRWISSQRVAMPAATTRAPDSRVSQTDGHQSRRNPRVSVAPSCFTCPGYHVAGKHQVLRLVSLASNNVPPSQIPALRRMYQRTLRGGGRVRRCERSTDGNSTQWKLRRTALHPPSIFRSSPKRTDQNGRGYRSTKVVKTGSNVLLARATSSSKSSQ